MKTALILDTETTGKDPEKDSVIEVGCVIWSIGFRRVTGKWSSLITSESNAAEAINDIPADLLRQDLLGICQPEVVWRKLKNTMLGVDVVLAHNAEFDRSFLPEQLRVLNPWICTQDDIEWPKASSSQKLTDIAPAHGVGVVDSHRALTDCDIIERLLRRVSETHDVAAMLERALRQKKKYQAVVTFDTNHLAKERGFRWDPSTKMWWRKFVPEDVPALQLPFELREVA